MFELAAGTDLFEAAEHVEAVGIDLLEVADAADGRNLPPGLVSKREALQQALVVHVCEDAGQRNVAEIGLDVIDRVLEVARVDGRITEAVGKRGLEKQPLRTHAGAETLAGGVNGGLADAGDDVFAFDTRRQHGGGLDGRGVGGVVAMDHDVGHGGLAFAQGLDDGLVCLLGAPAFGEGLGFDLGKVAAEGGLDCLDALGLDGALLGKRGLDGGIHVHRRGGLDGLGFRRGLSGVFLLVFHLVFSLFCGCPARCDADMGF